MTTTTIMIYGTMRGMEQKEMTGMRAHLNYTGSCCTRIYTKEEKTEVKGSNTQGAPWEVKYWVADGKPTTHHFSHRIFESVNYNSPDRCNIELPSSSR